MDGAITKNGAMERFRAAAHADPALQAALGVFEDLGPAIPVAIARAAALGISLDEATLRAGLPVVPMGMERYMGAPPTLDMPLPGWLPVQVAPMFGQICVDWAWFGDRPLRESFYEDSLRGAMRRPLTRLLHYRTLLGNLPAVAQAMPLQKPAGFIFHMSRCGSTLAAQMLAADPRNVVISEAAPLDSLVQLPRFVQNLPHETHVALLRLMAGTLAQKRDPAHARAIIKLDSWHTLALPLFREAFPDVPWVFLYREPVEVLASQMLERGMQTVPEFLPPAMYGLEGADIADSDGYCARVLARTCEAVLEPLRDGGGLLVNYRELPEALFTRILPHFGIAAGAEERAMMSGPTRFNAKMPDTVFESREEAKREIIDDALRANADEHIGAVYRELERLRAGG